MDEDPFPSLGITLQGITLFMEKCGGSEAMAGLCTAAVCERFVKPATAASQDSYVRLLADAESPAVGPATVFVSHAWGHEFVDVVAALTAWERRHSSGTPV